MLVKQFVTCKLGSIYKIIIVHIIVDAIFFEMYEGTSEGFIHGVRTGRRKLTYPKEFLKRFQKRILNKLVLINSK